METELWTLASSSPCWQGEKEEKDGILAELLTGWVTRKQQHVDTLEELRLAFQVFDEVRT